MSGGAQGSTISHGVTKSVHQDVFTVPSDYALAHCVASEFQMSRGIARVFRSKFTGIGNSEHQRSVVGEAKLLFQKTGVVFKDINMISTIRSVVQFSYYNIIVVQFCY